ncbi:MAG TPA: ABC transporter permease [Microvirga sp.]|jgi:putative ABC transport system permease protein
MNPWLIIRASLRRYRLSALAFVLLIAAGTSLSVAIVSQERALRTGSARAADRFDLVVAAPGSRTDALLTSVFLQPGSARLMSPAATARLLNETEATFVSPLAFGDNIRGAPIVGVTAPLVEHLSGGLAEGRPFRSRQEAVIGSASPLKVGQTFRPAHGAASTGHNDHDHEEHEDEDRAAEGTHGHDRHPVELTVVGRMKPTGSPWDRAVTVPVELVWDTHGLPSGHPEGSDQIGAPFDPARTPGIPAAVVHVRSVASAYKLRQAYSTNESMAFFPAEALIQLYAIVGDVRQLMSVLAVITQALVLLAILASVFILLRLLMPQYVTLRALGAPRSYIFLTAWGFMAALVTAGVATGLVGGYGLSLGISRWLSSQTGIALTPSLGTFEILMALAIVAIGFALALLPALHLQRRPLAEALARF